MQATLAAVASAARTTTGVSSAIAVATNTVSPTLVALAVNVTAVSGTTPTLDLSVEWSTDGGTTWFVGQPADTFTQVTATGTAIKTFTPKAPHCRVRWTIAGTTPSFTFAVDLVDVP